MESEENVSVSGVQVGLLLVAFVVFQTPPFTDATQTTFAFVGWATTALMAPTTGEFVMPIVWPFWMGAGPCALHVPPTGESDSATGRRSGRCCAAPGAGREA